MSKSQTNDISKVSENKKLQFNKDMGKFNQNAKFNTSNFGSHKFEEHKHLNMIPEKVNMMMESSMSSKRSGMDIDNCRL
jgi:hypothetical protein